MAKFVNQVREEVRGSQVGIMHVVKKYTMQIIGIMMNVEILHLIKQRSIL